MKEKAMRSYRPWSKREEEALLKGVAKYGVGCWNDIKRDSDLYESLLNRSGVQIKDKWRNLVKFKLVKPEDFSPQNQAPRKKRKARSPSQSPTAIPSSSNAEVLNNTNTALALPMPEPHTGQHSRWIESVRNTTDSGAMHIQPIDIHHALYQDTANLTQLQLQGQRQTAVHCQEGMNPCEVQAAQEVIKLLLQSGNGSRLHIPEETLQACHPELKELLGPYLGNNASTSRPCDEVSTSPAASAMTSFSELIAAGTQPPGCLSLAPNPQIASPSTVVPSFDASRQPTKLDAACASPSKPTASTEPIQTPSNGASRSAFMSWTESSTVDVPSSPRHQNNVVAPDHHVAAKILAALGSSQCQQACPRDNVDALTAPVPGVQPPPLFSDLATGSGLTPAHLVTNQSCAAPVQQNLDPTDMTTPVAMAILQLLALASGAEVNALQNPDNIVNHAQPLPTTPKT